MAVLDFSPSLGLRITIALRQADMTQTELAGRLHVNSSTVSRWTRDQIPVDVATLMEIARETKQYWLLNLRDLLDADGNPGLGEPSSGWMWVTAGQAVKN